MTQTVSANGKKRGRVPYHTICAALDGDTEALARIQRHFDAYIRSMATILVHGTRSLDTEPHHCIKQRVIAAALKFPL